MFGLFNRDKWALVKSFQYKLGFRSLYIHCFESEKGRRRIEYVYDGALYNIKNDDYGFKKSEFFQMRLYRWMYGRRDVEIPRFSEIDEDDLVYFLKNK